MADRNFTEVAVLLRDNDNVAVLKRPLKSGDHLVNGSIDLRAAENIGAGHKIAVAEIADGAPVRRYGQIIGFAQGRIAPGSHVHTHNVVMKEFGRDYQFCADATAIRY